VPGSRHAGRSRRLECGARKHIRDHARLGHDARLNVIRQIRYVFGDVRHAQRNGNIVLGIDIAAGTAPSGATSTLKPEIASVTNADGKTIPVQHSVYNAKVAKANKISDRTTSAVLVTVKVPKGDATASYNVNIKGLDGTTGTYLVGFYLPGDVAGTGEVTKDDLKTIKEDKNMTAENSNYNFDADVNRDGIINMQDYQIAKEDLGASTAVSPVVSVNLDPSSNPALDGTTPYSSVVYEGNATPGATISFLDQATGVTTTTTAAAKTGTYSITVPLATGSNTFTVTTQDAFGQSITGAITPVVYSPSASNAPKSG